MRWPISKAAKRYARYLEGIIDETEAADDELIEQLKHERTVEDGIALIANAAPDKTVTSIRAQRLIGLAGIGTQGAVLQRAEPDQVLRQGRARHVSPQAGLGGDAPEASGQDRDARQRRRCEHRTRWRRVRLWIRRPVSSCSTSTKNNSTSI